MLPRLDPQDRLGRQFRHLWLRTDWLDDSQDQQWQQICAPPLAVDY
jgi:hypothetical protein